MSDRVILDMFLPYGTEPESFCLYLYWQCVRNGGSRSRVLGGHWGFLIRDSNDRVILDVMDDVFYPKEDTLKVLY